MTENEKQLLLKDLSARLPYGVVIHTYYNKSIDIKCTGCDLFANTINLDIPNDDEAKVYIDNCKPYLRPLSSMTEEEDKEWQYYKNAIVESCNEKLGYKIGALHNWLNSHHFDYRGLIPMGLALKAPEGMYKTK